MINEFGNSRRVGFFCSVVLHIIFFSLLFTGIEKEKKKVTWVSLVEKPTINTAIVESTPQKQKEGPIEHSESSTPKKESIKHTVTAKHESKIGIERQKKKQKKEKKTEENSVKQKEKKDSVKRYEKEAKEILKETISRVAASDVLLGGSDIESDYESDPIFLEYVKKLWKKVSDNWYIPRNEQFSELECVISVEIEQDGTIRQYIIEKTSGSSVFDSLAVSALKRSEPFSPLPPHINTKVEIGFRFKGSEGKTY